MTPDERAGDALFRDPLPAGFSRRILCIPPGRELGMEQGRLHDAIVVVERGELEVECLAGTRRRFGHGAMVPIARLPVSRLRSVGSRLLVLVAVSRVPRRATDESGAALGSHEGG